MVHIGIEAFYSELCERIKTERIRRELSQEQVGEHLGIKRSTINNLEKGRHRPSIYQLIMIADLFAMELGDFITGYKNEDLKNQKLVKPNFDKAVTDGSKNIDKSTKTEVLNFLSSIKK